MIRALMLAAAMAIVAGGAHAAPLEVYGQLPDIEQVALSPDGARLAVLLGGGEDRKILIRELDGGGEKLMSVGDIKVRYLAGQGVIDPKRVCIVGASYGGYAALAGATLDRGVYRCAASVAGVSDLRRMVSWSRGQNGRTAQRYWIRFMGAEDPNDPILVGRSPAAKVEGVTTPILLIHGRDDTVVPLEQSQIMQKALKAAGQDAELIIMDGEDHWLSRGDTRLLMLNAVAAFLEKNNPPS